MTLVSNRSYRRHGFTLIELLVVLAVIAILIGLLLPAVQAAREAVRRIQCTNNLKQIALAAYQYADVWAILPRGGYLQRITAGGGLYDSAGNPILSGGVFPSLLPFLEQKPLYDSMNVSVNIYTSINATISAVGISTLWCPSDSGIADEQSLPDGNFYDPGAFIMHYTSYDGNFGTWHMGWTPGYNDRLNGLFNADGAVRLASITDGLSNTIAFGERTRNILASDERIYYHWWISGFIEDTLFVTFYPLNPKRIMPNNPNDAMGGAY